MSCIVYPWFMLIWSAKVGRVKSEIQVLSQYFVILVMIMSINRFLWAKRLKANKDPKCTNELYHAKQPLLLDICFLKMGFWSLESWRLWVTSCFQSLGCFGPLIQTALGHEPFSGISQEQPFMQIPQFQLSQMYFNTFFFFL